MYRLARQQVTQGNRDFALDIIKNANAELRSGDKGRAGTILAMGLATLSPSSASTKAALALEDRKTESTSLPEALHAGWRANFEGGVAALIFYFTDRLLTLKQAGGDHGLPPLNNFLHGTLPSAHDLCIEGRPDEALAALRAAPAYQSVLNLFQTPIRASGSNDVASRALSMGHKELDKFTTIVNGDDDAPAGTSGQNIRYARENPDVIRTRGLVQSVGADLFRLGAYSEVLATVRPPVPPRDVVGSAPINVGPNAGGNNQGTSAVVSPLLPDALHAGWLDNLGKSFTALVARAERRLDRLEEHVGVWPRVEPRDRELFDAMCKEGKSVSEHILKMASMRDRLGYTREAFAKSGLYVKPAETTMMKYRRAITDSTMLGAQGDYINAIATLRSAPWHESILRYGASEFPSSQSKAALRVLASAHTDLDRFTDHVNGDEEGSTPREQIMLSHARNNPDVIRIRGLVQSIAAELYRAGDFDAVHEVLRPPLPPRPSA
jgi:hypothetical protein